MTERWQRTFRQGIAPQLSDAELYRLKAGLAMDSDRIVQRRNCQWTSIGLVCCPLCYASGLPFIEYIEEWFLRLALGCNERMGEVGSIRHFTTWVDTVPRDLMRRDLLAEVEEEEERRAKERTATI